MAELLVWFTHQPSPEAAPMVYIPAVGQLLRQLAEPSGPTYSGMGRAASEMADDSVKQLVLGIPPKTNGSAVFA